MKGATNDELQRSIPACAGEPDRENLPLARWTVYPRVRGGTDGLHLFSEAATGLSPRARGNQRIGLGGRCEIRSIPACAGEPSNIGGSGYLFRVYPRVRGGTPMSAQPMDSYWGLSPRARGNRRVGALEGHDLRSIPACAGEPQLML